MDCTRLGLRLTRYRQRLRLSMTQLAHQSGVDSMQISQSGWQTADGGWQMAGHDLTPLRFAIRHLLPSADGPPAYELDVAHNTGESVSSIGES